MVDYQNLKEFLETLTYQDFKDNVKIKEAHTIEDERWRVEGGKHPLPKDQIINYGDYFLVDAVGNDLSVCKKTKRDYKLPTGRVVSMKLEQILIANCRKQFGSPLNGIWAIPKEFIK